MGIAMKGKGGINQQLIFPMAVFHIVGVVTLCPAVELVAFYQYFPSFIYY
jgi:hypothetical protein